MHRVDACKKLEETMHAHVRHLSQDSTFDLSCQTQGVAYLQVRLIHWCLQQFFYGSFYMYSKE